MSQTILFKTLWAITVCALASIGQANADDAALCTRYETTLSEMFFGAPDDIVSFTAEQRGNKIEMNALMREGKSETHSCMHQWADSSLLTTRLVCATLSLSEQETEMSKLSRHVSIKECSFWKSPNTNPDNQIQYIATCRLGKSTQLKRATEEYSTDALVMFWDWESYYVCDKLLPDFE